MTSRQRMLAALNRGEPDYAPCSFMLFNGLKDQCSSYLEFLERQLELGLDVYVQIPPRPPVVVNDYYNLHGLPVSYSPAVEIREWKEHLASEEHPILVKEYRTPAGTLRAEVRQDEDWRWGDHVPFLDDYLVTRSRKFLVREAADLEALRSLLVPPTEAEIQSFRQEAQPAIDFARWHDLLLAGGWGAGADVAGWVFGLEQMMIASYEAPDVLHDLLDLIAGWNRARMEAVLSAGIDLYIKRAWYENSSFWSPKGWRKFLLPILQQESELAHAYGAKFAYLITAACMPLLELFGEAGIDVVMGVDPKEWDLAQTKTRLGGQICLWGGVNGHLTVEQGTPQAVEQEVETALEILAPGGGFILSPVDNVRQYSPREQENVAALLSAWRRSR
jgi:uroporphyrinogen-III decarboxylase